MADPEPLTQEADPPISKVDVELEMADNMVQKKLNENFRAAPKSSLNF